MARKTITETSNLVQMRGLITGVTYLFKEKDLKNGIISKAVALTPYGPMYVKGVYRTNECISKVSSSKFIKTYDEIVHSQLKTYLKI